MPCKGSAVGEAAETEPVKPVPEEHIPVVQPYVTPQIWAMVNLQLWTGCRPGEACLIRGIDLKMDGDVWEYRPHSHKGRAPRTGANHLPRPARPGGHQALAEDGPASVPVLAAGSPGMAPSPTSRETKDARSVEAQDQAEGESQTQAGRVLHDVRLRACNQRERASKPEYQPGLRTSSGIMRRPRSGQTYGIEAARIILGHASAVTSEIYAEIDREKAREIMRKIG